MNKELNPKGLQIRKEMFGEEFVAKRLANATDFSRPFVEIINDFAYGEVWTRPGLDRKARSMLTLGMLIALDKPQEIKLHVKVAINNGVSKDEIREILIHSVVYCGFPAVVEAYRACTESLKELGLE